MEEERKHQLLRELRQLELMGFRNRSAYNMDTDLLELEHAVQVAKRKYDRHDLRGLVRGIALAMMDIMHGVPESEEKEHNRREFIDLYIASALDMKSMEETQ